jgi:hypothetical protein
LTAFPVLDFRPEQVACSIRWFVNRILITKAPFRLHRVTPLPCNRHVTHFLQYKSILVNR